MNITVWLILLIVFLIVEATTVSLVCIWFAGGSIIGLIAAALHAPWWLQILLALAVSLVLLIFTRPIAVKYFNKGRIKTNVNSLIGKQAIVIGEINNLQETGQVMVGHQQWTARSAEDGVIIPEGAVVVIEEIKGVKLMVRDATPAVEKAVTKVNEE